MMLRSSALILSLCLAGTLLPAGARAQEAPAPAEAAVSPAVSHPYCDWEGMYPRWSRLTPQQGLQDVRYGMQLARERLEALCQVKPEEATYDNTFAVLEQLDREMNRAQLLMYHLSSVMDNTELRQVQETLLPEETEFSASLSSNERLWAVIRHAANQPWVRTLSPARQRYVQQVVDSFKDSGADLPADKKARKVEIIKELSRLTHQFSKNVLDARNSWQLVITQKSELAGLSESWLNTAAAAAREKGYGTAEAPNWLITLDDTSVLEVLKHCDVEETRRLCWLGRAGIGSYAPHDNAPIVARVMELRRELATLLGFGTFADLQTARRMVGSGQNALHFVDEMMRKVKPAFDREVADFLQFVSECKGHKVSSIKPWETTYYNTRYKEERFQFDQNALRPYLSCENVVQGMFSIYQKLYGIRISEVPSVWLLPGQELPEGMAEVWHPDVKLFAVHDAATGQHLGSFYMDLFPRDSKRGGAWVLGLDFHGYGQEGKPHSPHLGVLIGNHPMPTEDKPALFTQYDVTTIFHEFGHMMHCMLSHTELTSHAGTGVAWDFVELPSQLQENWTWIPEGITTYARHWQTGEPMPQELLEKLQKTRYTMPAMDNMNQLCIAKLDLEMHMFYDEKFKGRPLDEASAELLDPWRMPFSVRMPSIMRNLEHCISGGYAAGYYSYKWAEVLAADAFTRFAKEGPLNPATGASFRKEILSQGDSRPAAEIFRNFMGREPNPDALLQAQGL